MVVEIESSECSVMNTRTYVSSANCLEFFGSVDFLDGKLSGMEVDLFDPWEDVYKDLLKRFGTPDATAYSEDFRFIRGLSCLEFRTGPTGRVDGRGRQPSVSSAAVDFTLGYSRALPNGRIEVTGRRCWGLRFPTLRQKKAKDGAPGDWQHGGKQILPSLTDFEW